ncbi:hypothetical protein [Mycobacteroides abscessus]|uniref:hypothetical protein n=1 Tax=Mycobacteroides abscessus TaxID=36809 RepID=UPI000C257176|nr:hypothetical protein [Mycobacteroides abscessus]
MAYKLSKADHVHLGDIRSSVEALTSRIEEMQSEWDNATERWQESDRGYAVQEWLTQLEDKLREIGDLTDEIEDADPA